MTRAYVLDGEPTCPRDEDPAMSLFDPEDSVEDDGAEDADEDGYSREQLELEYGDTDED